MSKRFLFLVLIGVLSTVSVFMFGYVVGQKKSISHALGLQFGSLVMGVSSLESIREGDIHSVERRIRLQCYIDSMLLLNNKRWKDNNLVAVYARELWDVKQKTNSVNESVTEKRFDATVRHKLAVDHNWGIKGDKY